MPDWDEIEGKAKETAGKVTDDESLEREGQAQGAFGEAKEKAGDAFDEAKEEVEERI